MEQRSTFITVTAWIFIVLSALMMLQASLMSFTPLDKFFPPAASGRTDPALMQGFMRGLFLVMAIVAAWVLLSSIGLLLRKNWARVSFIVMMILGIGWNSLYVLMGALAAVLMGSMAKDPTVPPEVVAMMPAVFGVMAVMGLLFIALFGLILYKLLTDRIKREFLPAND